jgi:hypothetical protein
MVMTSRQGVRTAALASGGAGREEVAGPHGFLQPPTRVMRGGQFSRQLREHLYRLRHADHAVELPPMLGFML